jgi:hypothetical protein
VIGSTCRSGGYAVGEVCKTLIAGSTPAAASNKSPAQGDFLACVSAHIGPNADILPTDESQVVLDSFGLPCKLRFWVRVTAS